MECLLKTLWGETEELMLLFWGALFVGWRVERWEGWKGGRVVRWEGGKGGRVVSWQGEKCERIVS